MNGSHDSPDDRLAQVLRAADQAAPPPALRPDIADTVRLLAQRRSAHRRVATGSVAAVVLVASTAALMWSAGPRRGAVERGALLEPRPATARVVPHHDEPARLATQFRRAKEEADLRFAIATKLTAGERNPRPPRPSNDAVAAFSPTQFNRVAFLRGDAALTLVGQADRLNSRANSPRDALATYRRAVELFPDTPAASVARRRIESLESQLQVQEIRHEL